MLSKLESIFTELITNLRFFFKAFYELLPKAYHVKHPRNWRVDFAISQDIIEIMFAEYVVCFAEQEWNKYVMIYLFKVFLKKLVGSLHVVRIPVKFFLWTYIVIFFVCEQTLTVTVFVVKVNIDLWLKLTLILLGKYFWKIREQFGSSNQSFIIDLNLLLILLLFHNEVYE